MFTVPSHAERVEQFNAQVALWKASGDDRAALDLLVFMSPLRTSECHRILAEMGIR